MLKMILDCSIALLALINPISKVFVVSSLYEESASRTVNRILLKASFVAILILTLFTVIGNPLLKYVFQVEIYSFKIAGGIVLVLRGFLALNKGLFFEKDTHQKLEDMSIVPLASPLIAGPATITAAVSFPAKYSILSTLIAIICAVFLNLIVMLFSKRISEMLSKYNLMGALIRITGLIVATVGIQMMLNGLEEYIIQIGT